MPITDIQTSQILQPLQTSVSPIYQNNDLVVAQLRKELNDAKEKIKTLENDKGEIAI